MKWKKIGQIFCPEKNYPWMYSHASNPTQRLLDEYIFRIYFSCRDIENHSSIGYVDIDIRKPEEILNISDHPILAPGQIGAFDDSGVSMGCIIDQGDQVYLYYLGWNLGVTVPWRNSIGLALGNKVNKKFKRVSLAPVLDRNKFDPYSLTYPWVIKDNDIWRMWYGSSLTWGNKRSDFTHVIKYAESNDGIEWHPTGDICIDLDIDHEIALTRPCVIKDPDIYKMWYSVCSKEYRIGYAESEDGIEWNRLDDKAGITPSKSGWDKLSIEYPCVFDHDGQRYMLYNGYNFGITGFGLAILENG